MADDARAEGRQEGVAIDTEKRAGRNGKGIPGEAGNGAEAQSEGAFS
jgi:hypothetical protein